MNKKDFKQEMLPKKGNIDISNVFGVSDDRTVLKRGSLQSPKFVKKKKGWSIDENGDAWFRNLNIYGGSQGGALRVVDTDQSIQSALDEVHNAGGGTVLIQNGIHKQNNNLIMYSDTYLIGQNSESAIIDFQNTAHGIVIQGSNAYSTGTISATAGSTTIVGSGTTFTSAMVGQDILIKGLWYPIASFIDATHITIGLPYSNINVTGYNYVIATKVNDTHILTLTIKNSLSYGIYHQYGNEIQFTDINIQSCAYGVYGKDGSNINYDIMDLAGNAYGIYSENLGLFVIKDTGSIYTTTGAGFDFNNCYGGSLRGVFLELSATNGISFTDCDNISGNGVISLVNGSNGLEFISGNNKIILMNVGAEGNTDDGIKLTASCDNCIVSNNILYNNGGYGINIADATCDKNDIRGNLYSGNTSGDYNDSGTDTQKDLEIFANDQLRLSSDTEGNTQSESYIKVKEARMDIDGELRVKFDLKVSNTLTTAYGRIYKNGVAIGSEHTNDTISYVTYSDDVSINKGDYIQLYVKINDNGGGSYDTYYKNFRIYFDPKYGEIIT